MNCRTFSQTPGTRGKSHHRVCSTTLTSCGILPEQLGCTTLFACRKKHSWKDNAHRCLASGGNSLPRPLLESICCTFLHSLCFTSKLRMSILLFCIHLWCPRPFTHTHTHRPLVIRSTSLAGVQTKRRKICSNFEYRKANKLRAVLMCEVLHIKSRCLHKFISGTLNGWNLDI